MFFCFFILDPNIDFCLPHDHSTLQSVMKALSVFYWLPDWILAIECERDFGLKMSPFVWNANPSYVKMGKGFLSKYVYILRTMLKHVENLKEWEVFWKRRNLVLSLDQSKKLKELFLLIETFNFYIKGDFYEKSNKCFLDFFSHFNFFRYMGRCCSEESWPYFIRHTNVSHQ